MIVSRYLLMAAPQVQKSRPVALQLKKSRMHGEDRRRQLLRIAIESFARQGFGGTKTKDIAAAAGVSEAILFRHFASKEDLYHAILDSKETPEGTNQRLRELQAFAARRDDTGLFLNVAATIVRSFREDPAFHRLLMYASLEGHLLASLFRERFGLPMGNFLRRYIALRQKEGAFHKCDPNVAMMFFCGSIVQYAMTRHLFGVQNHPMDDEAVAKELVILVMRGLVMRGLREKKKHEK
jgi:TetR/AcrR family transcriptional regulator